MTDTLLGIAVTLLGVTVVLLVGLLIQSRRQHRELIEWLDSYAEMVGEFIDSWRSRK